jgi:hypothetical protein
MVSTRVTKDEIVNDIQLSFEQMTGAYFTAARLYEPFLGLPLQMMRKNNGGSLPHPQPTDDQRNQELKTAFESFDITTTSVDDWIIYFTLYFELLKRDISDVEYVGSYLTVSRETFPDVFVSFDSPYDLYDPFLFVMCERSGLMMPDKYKF